jgi:Chromosome segregation ATPases
MWNALRSDLKEFATSIASDGHAIRDQIETNLIQPDQSNEDDIDDGASDDARDQDLVIGEHGEVAYLAGDQDGFGAVNEPLYEAQREAQRRAGLEETYLIPLLAHEVNGSKTLPIKKSHNFTKDTKENSNQEGLGMSQEEGSLKSESSPGGEPMARSNDETNDNFQNDTMEGEECLSQVNPKVVDDNQEDHDHPRCAIEDGDDPDIVSFLNTFRIDSKTDDIGEILTKYPDTVGFFFEKFVPLTVTYEQFCQRYYFRCDPERIQLEWDIERERIKQERQEFIDKGKKTVKNLFGGALKVIKGSTISQDSHNVEQGTESIYEKYQAELEEKRKALQEASSRGSHDQKQDNSNKLKSGGGFGGLFTNVRPPFVMNTAVDDEDDDSNSQDDAYTNDLDDAKTDPDQEQEEEDLGWGSDEDELSVEGAEGDDVTEGTEEVVFSSNAEETQTMKQLQYELTAALEKNKSLEKILRDQQEQLGGKIGCDNELNLKSEVEKLQLELFRKDSELAAVKASLEELVEDNTHEQNIELKRLRTELQRKELELEKFRETVREADVMQDEEDAKDSEMLAEALDTITALQSELESSKLEANNELMAMKDQYEDQISQMENELKVLQATVAENKNTISSLQIELDVQDDELSKVKHQFAALQKSSKTEVDCAMEKISSLETQLHQYDTSQEGLRDMSSEKEKEAAEMISSLQSELMSTKSELAATKSSASEEIQKLKESIVYFENSKTSLLSELESSKTEISRLQKSINESCDDNSADALQNALELVSSLQSELNDAKKECSKLQDEINFIRKSQDNDKSELSCALDEAKKTIEVLKKNLEESKRIASDQSSELSSTLELSNATIDKTRTTLEAEISKLNSKVEILENEKGKFLNEIAFLKNKIDEYQSTDRNDKFTCESPTPSSPNNEGSSFSSGVEVHQPSASPSEVKECDGDADDDGWGDDWSDDDDH